LSAIGVMVLGLAVVVTFVVVDLVLVDLAVVDLDLALVDLDSVVGSEFWIGVLVVLFLTGPRGVDLADPGKFDFKHPISIEVKMYTFMLFCPKPSINETGSR
jgi:hypothetical protein